LPDKDLGRWWPGAALKKRANKKGGANPTASARKTESVAPRKSSRRPEPAVKKGVSASTKAMAVAKIPANGPAQTSKPTTKTLHPKKTAATVPTGGDHRKGSTDNGSPRSRGNRDSATSQDPIQFPEEAPMRVETFLNDKQLSEFRELLLEKRRALTGDVERIADQAMNRKEHGFNETSTMPIHMADLGSDTWEQDFNLGLLASETGLVREIDAALQRIEDRTYGICIATDARITVARLRAKPWAKYCIEYERKREEGRVP
jgi:DnaK suppressor protein